MLEAVVDFEIVGEAATGEEAVSEVEATNPDVVLMDVKMPGIGGLEATQKLHSINPELKIIIVSSCTEDPFPTLLLQAGASAYLTKGAHFNELEQAVRQVSIGNLYFGSEISQRLAAKNLFDPNDSPFGKLSEREFQIMMMLIHGEMTQAIAKKLNLTTTTVHTYRYRIFKKLNVNSDVGLANLALRYGFFAGRVLF